MKNARIIAVGLCIALLLAVFVGVNAVGGAPVRGYCQYGGPSRPYEFAHALYEEAGTFYPPDSIVSDSESNYDVALEKDMNQLIRLGTAKVYAYIHGVKTFVREIPVVEYGRDVCQMVTCR